MIKELYVLYGTYAYDPPAHAGFIDYSRIIACRSHKIKQMFDNKMTLSDRKDKSHKIRSANKKKAGIKNEYPKLCKSHSGPGRNHHAAAGADPCRTVRLEQSYIQPFGQAVPGEYSISGGSADCRCA